MEDRSLTEGLEPVSFQSITDIVELRLIAFFKSKLYQPGDKIPKEKELVAALGVSRTVVRQALSRLRRVGIIDTPKKCY